MNRKIEVEFVEKAHAFEVQAVTAATPEKIALDTLRKRFWLGWQLFGREARK
jgi:hypothetical protein